MLGDFGVAHLPDATGQAPAAGSAATTKKSAVGTLAYMAPEQRRGEVAAASDIYASAIILFEMLTGHTPGGRGGVIGGVRAAADFRLPDAIFADAPSVAADVQSHLDRLASVDATKRPTTKQALAESQRLRERIIAAGAT
jgi:serine/threonine protein kinase